MKTYKIPTYKCQLVRDRGFARVPCTKLSTFEQASAVMRYLTNDSPFELFVAMYVDGQNNVVGVETVSKGGQHGCAVSAREVLRGALVMAASGVILGHNHPSGDPKPSLEDIQMTEAICKAADVLGIKVLDHIIVARGTDKTQSLFDYGLPCLIATQTG